jgi:hypothetical protein
MKGLRDLEFTVKKTLASSALISIRTGSASHPTTPNIIRTMPNAANSTYPS